MTQSPSKTNSTISNDKKIVQGVGYSTIYRSETRKYELSVQETSLRRTVIINSERHERLYTKVDNREIIKKIEFSSERWEQYGIGNTYNYIIMEQRNAEGKLTGYIKIIKKSRASVRGVFHTVVEANKSDWTYYKRRIVGQ